MAVTRAQALLIIVGDPKVLSMNPVWRGFLNYVHLKGSWKGRAIDWDPTEPVVSEASAGRRGLRARLAIAELTDRADGKEVVPADNQVDNPGNNEEAG